MKTTLNRVLAALLFVVIFGLASGPIVSGDLFWQLQGGRYMVETGDFIYQDTFSLDAGAPRWEHCWLHDLIAYGIFQVGGYEGIALLRGAVIATAVVALFLAARTRGAELVSTLLLLPPLLVQTHRYWRDRPQIWTFLCFALFLLLLERCRSGGASRRLLLLLPVVTVLWANLHAGVALAVPVMAAYGVGTWLDSQRYRLGFEPVPFLPGRTFVCCCGLVVAAMLATPYAAQTFQTFLHIMQLRDAPMTAANLDWRPATYAAFPFYYGTAAASLALMLLAFRKICFIDALLLGGLFYSGTYYERNIIFFLFAAIVIVPSYLDHAAQAAAARLEPLARTWKVLATTAAVVLTIVVFRNVYVRNGFFSPGINLDNYPARSAEFIGNERLPANIFNSYDAGGYLMWALFPRYQVFWDSRQTSMRMHNAGQIIANGQPGVQRLLDHYRINTLVVQPMNLGTGRRWKLLDVLDEKEWALVFVDRLYVVLVRNNAVSPVWLESHRLPLRVKDAMILGMAEALAASRPHAHWEAARIYFRRGDEVQGRAALERYLKTVPPAELAAEALEKSRDIYGAPGG